LANTLLRLSSDAPTFDLQSHSVHSDGALTPREVVAAAAAAGVELFSLTDHDTVAGVREAAEAADELGVRLVSGVEISAIAGGSVGDLHILGYLVDDADPVLSQRLQGYREDRRRRGSAMVDAIREQGFALDVSVLRERVAQGKSLGRPHLAEAAVSHPDNGDRLLAEGLTDPSAFLEAYLIEGRPAFRPRLSPSVPESIAAIHDAGGVAVWAHPFWDVADPDTVKETIDWFRELGLDGVECFYVTHSREQTELLVDHCEQRNLLTTGSSDFHGPNHRKFSCFRAFETFGRQPRLGPLAS
jgi:predicted metal-dependent phosphoesterase TrpH